MEFAHLTFQEFLTSKHWIESKGNPPWARLVSDSWWQETIRLYAAQSDASAIVEACLQINNDTTLGLATDCLYEARDIDAPLRAKMESVVVASMQDGTTRSFRTAASVFLNKTLRDRFIRLDDDREISSSLVTNAEYQLFIESARIRGSNVRPDHWDRSVFPIGTANEPVRGVRYEDAESYCIWLSARYGGGLRYRLPTTQEARSPWDTNGVRVSSPLAVWVKEDSVGLHWLESSEESVKQQLAKYSILENIDCPEILALLCHYPLSLAICLDHRTDADWYDMIHIVGRFDDGSMDVDPILINMDILSNSSQALMAAIKEMKRGVHRGYWSGLADGVRIYLGYSAELRRAQILYNNVMSDLPMGPRDEEEVAGAVFVSPGVFRDIALFSRLGWRRREAEVGSDEVSRSRLVDTARRERLNILLQKIRCLFDTKTKQNDVVGRNFILHMLPRIAPTAAMMASREIIDKCYHQGNVQRLLRDEMRKDYDPFEGG